MVKQLLIWLLVKFKPDCRLTMGSNWSEVAVSTLLKRLPMISATPISTGRFLHRMARFDIFIFLANIWWSSACRLLCRLPCWATTSRTRWTWATLGATATPLSTLCRCQATTQARFSSSLHCHDGLPANSHRGWNRWYSRILSTANSHLTEQNRTAHLRSGPSFAGRLFYLAFYAGNLLGTAIIAITWLSSERYCWTWWRLLLWRKPCQW